MMSGALKLEPRPEQRNHKAGEEQVLREQERDLRQSNSQTQPALFCVEPAVSCRSDGKGRILGRIRISQWLWGWGIL